MCLSSPDPPEPPPAPKPKWWLFNHPEIKEPKKQLNEEATKESKKKKQKTGTQKLQIPLAPQGTKSGLSIPKQ